MLEDAQVRRFRHRALERQAARLEEAVEAHDAEADRAFAAGAVFGARHFGRRSEEHTSELQSLMRISYAVFCLKKKITSIRKDTTLSAQQPEHTRYELHDAHN